MLGEEEEDGAGIVATSVTLRVHLFAEERSVQVVPAETCSLGWAGLGLPEGARKQMPLQGLGIMERYKLSLRFKLIK